MRGGGRREVKGARCRERKEWDEDARAGPPKDMPVRKGGGMRVGGKG